MSPHPHQRVSVSLALVIGQIPFLPGRAAAGRSNRASLWPRGKKQAEKCLVHFSPLVRSSLVESSISPLLGCRPQVNIISARLGAQSIQGKGGREGGAAAPALHELLDDPVQVGDVDRLEQETVRAGGFHPLSGLRGEARGYRDHRDVAARLLDGAA